MIMRRRHGRFAPATASSPFSCVSARYPFPRGWGSSRRNRSPCLFVPMKYNNSGAAYPLFFSKEKAGKCRFAGSIPHSLHPTMLGAARPATPVRRHRTGTFTLVFASGLCFSPAEAFAFRRRLFGCASARRPMRAICAQLRAVAATAPALICAMLTIEHY